MKCFTHFTFLFILSLSIGCAGMDEKAAQDDSNGNQAIATSTEQSQKIIDHHLASFMQNDIKEVMLDYSAESKVVTPDSTYRGLAQIESFILGLFQGFPTEGSTIEMDRMVVDHDLVYFVWHGKSPTLNVSLATDTFIIQGGKIKYQTFAGVITPIAK